MAEAMEQILAAGLPVVGLSGPYTEEAKDQHVAADACEWLEFSSGWWRVDLSGDMDADQHAQLVQILEAMG